MGGKAETDDAEENKDAPEGDGDSEDVKEDAEEGGNKTKDVNDTTETKLAGSKMGQ